MRDYRRARRGVTYRRAEDGRTCAVTDQLSDTLAKGGRGWRHLPTAGEGRPRPTGRPDH